MSEHTPGPWIFCGNHVDDAHGRRLVSSSREFDELNPLDFCLIASAPCLLAAIDAALRIEHLWMPPDNENDPEYDEEFAALAQMRQRFREVAERARGDR